MTKEQFQNLRPGDRVVLTVKSVSAASTRQEKVLTTTCGATLFERGCRYLHRAEMQARYVTEETKGVLALVDKEKKQPLVQIGMAKGKTMQDELDNAHKRVALQTVADELNELVETK